MHEATSQRNETSLTLPRHPSQAAGEFVTDQLIQLQEPTLGEQLEADLQIPLERRHKCFRELIILGMDERDKFVDQIEFASAAAVRRDSTRVVKVGRLERLRSDPKLISASISDIRLKARRQEGSRLNTNVSQLKRTMPAMESSFARSSILDKISSKDEVPESKAVLNARELDETEGEIWEKLNSELQGQETWFCFNEWIAQKALESDGSVDSLLEMIAVDVHDQNSLKRMASIHANIAEKNPDAFEGEALKSLMDDPKEIGAELNRWIGLIMSGRGTEAIETLLENRDAWPESLRKAVTNRVDSTLQQQLELLKVRLKPYFMSYQQEPHPSNDTNAYITSIVNAGGKPNLISHNLKRKQQRGGRYTPPIRQATAVEVEVLPENRLYVARTINKELEYMEGEDVQDLVNKYLASYKGDESLRLDLEDIMANLREHPFGRGTTPFEEKFVQYEGHRVRVRRLNTTFQPDLPLRTDIAKDTRVVYVTQRNEDSSTDVGVLAILRHADYERWRP